MTLVIDGSRRHKWLSCQNPAKILQLEGVQYLRKKECDAENACEKAKSEPSSSRNLLTRDPCRC
jgi:hypothetical protein